MLKSGAQFTRAGAARRNREHVVAEPRLDDREFRNALGGFATGICVVTTRRPEGKREGLTVNSFSSVSLSPPIVLWNLSLRAPSAPAFRDAEYFAINVLAADQQDISQRFSQPAADKFAGIEDRVLEGVGGVPLLEGVVARFECRKQAQSDSGDHIVLFGLVERFEYWDRTPLLYHRGRYRTLTD